MSLIYKEGQYYGKGGSEMPAEDMSEVASPLPSVMSRRFKYSTEEQIVGEWIDGKPVYQKILVLSANVSRDGWIPFPDNNIDILIDYGGTGYFRTERHKRTFPWIVDLNIVANINSWNNTGLEYATNDSSNVLMSGSIIWLRYTKTTD